MKSRFLIFNFGSSMIERWKYPENVLEHKEVSCPSSGCDAVPFVSVIVLNYNGKEQIQRCFEAVLKMDYPRYEVIFIDNGSTDGSLEVARQFAAHVYPSSRFVEMKRNIGYSRGKNVGVSLSKGEFVWLLDNDIDPDADCLAKLVRFMLNHPDVAACGPTLVDYENRDKIFGGGFFMTRLLQPRPYTGALGKLTGFRYVSYITGGVLFVRKNVWNEIGGFDKSGTFFLDDHDFGPRCWISGWKVAVVHNCYARHFRLSRTRHDYWRWRFRLYAPGIIRGMIRNYTCRSLLVSLPAFFVYNWTKAFKNALWRRDPRILVDCALSFWKVGKDLPGSLKQRKRIQQLRVVRGDPFLGL